MKRFAQLALATAFAATALPALAAPDTFIIDTTHTFPRFSYSHFGYSTQLSRFDKTSGKITIDRAAKTGSVDVTIDMERDWVHNSTRRRSKRSDQTPPRAPNRRMGNWLAKPMVPSRAAEPVSR